MDLVLTFVTVFRLLVALRSSLAEDRDRAARDGVGNEPVTVHGVPVDRGEEVAAEVIEVLTRVVSALDKLVVTPAQ